MSNEKKLCKDLFNAIIDGVDVFLNQHDDLEDIYRQRYIENLETHDFDDDIYDDFDEYIDNNFRLYDILERLCITDIVPSLTLNNVEYYKVKRIIYNGSHKIINLDNFEKNTGVTVYCSIDNNISHQRYLTYYGGICINIRRCPPTFSIIKVCFMHIDISLIPERYIEHYQSVRKYISFIREHINTMKWIHNRIIAKIKEY